MIFKFRTWDRKEKRMEIVESISFDESLIDNSLMQYTNLNDENSKEIYVGDIVKYNALHPGTTIPDGFAGVVDFEECKFVVDNGITAVDLFTEFHTWEVIGNVYENKELLE